MMSMRDIFNWFFNRKQYKKDQTAKRYTYFKSRYLYRVTQGPGRSNLVRDSEDECVVCESSLLEDYPFKWLNELPTYTMEEWAKKQDEHFLDITAEVMGVSPDDLTISSDEGDDESHIDDWENVSVPVTEWQGDGDSRFTDIGSGDVTYVGSDELEVLATDPTLGSSTVKMSSGDTLPLEEDDTPPENWKLSESLYVSSEPSHSPCEPVQSKSNTWAPPVVDDTPRASTSYESSYSSGGYSSSPGDCGGGCD